MASQSVATPIPKVCEHLRYARVLCTFTLGNPEPPYLRYLNTEGTIGCSILSPWVGPEAHTKVWRSIPCVVWTEARQHDFQMRERRLQTLRQISHLQDFDLIDLD